MSERAPSLRVAGGRPAYGPRDRIVVVGGGAAGWAASGELRRLGFAGELVVLGAEPVGPYDRTACSKGLLDGRQRPQDTTLDLRGCPDVRWRVGVRAAGLDPYARRVVLESGRAVAYDGLVVATGTRASCPRTGRPAARPAPAARPGARVGAAVGAAPGPPRRRRRRRPDRLRGRLRGRPRWPGRPYWSTPSRYLMPRSIGEPVGALVTAEHRAAGIELRLGRRVAQAEHRRGGWRLLLDGGEQVAADLVVVTAGERPDVAWLAGTPADLSDGVLCDGSLRVVGLDGVVAAGALARWPNPRWGGAARPRRAVDHRRGAGAGRGPDAAGRRRRAARRAAAPLLVGPERPAHPGLRPAGRPGRGLPHRAAAAAAGHRPGRGGGQLCRARPAHRRGRGQRAARLRGGHPDAAGRAGRAAGRAGAGPTGAEERRLRLVR